VTERMATGVVGGGAPRLRRTESRTTPGRAVLIVTVAGVILTGALWWTAWTLNRNNEHRLLQVQSRQAAEVLNAAILAIRDPLTTSLVVARLSGGDPGAFASYVTPYTGPGKLFASMALVRTTGPSPVPVSTVGATALLPPDSATASALIARAAHSRTFVVRDVTVGGEQRIAYGIADPADPGSVVLAERPIPKSRVVPVERNAAFSDLDFATYIGDTTRLDALATTDVPLADLPLSGQTVRSTIPFGDTVITLVAAPRGHLGGTFGATLPWVLLVGGLALTAATASIAAVLVRRRRAAEEDSRTIAELYGRLDTLYAEQRSIAETLQRALLPQRNPAIAGLESATRYIAGGLGVEIGGDWFSVIELGPDRVAFSLGDVSGKGVGAAAIMARLRFSIRAYLLEGHPPDAVLAMCSRQLDVTRDGHLATVLVGTGDLRTGAFVVANAGHLDPVLVCGSGVETLPTSVGLPLGVAPAAYAATSFHLPPGTTFLAFTDGLVERRGEAIDAGLTRLARAAATTDPAGGPDALVESLVASMVDEDADDDVTLLAFVRSEGR
jgi:serine phosphatase RsbU (regulator of sigma subunit)